MARRYRELSANRSRDIACLAATVADDYFPDQRIDPLLILRDRGITYSFGDYSQAFDGVLECKDNRFHVYCNTTRCGYPPSPRARFTLAHELGHYYIDEHRRALLSGRADPHTSYCEFQSKWRVEREADLFATSLLMPPHRFERSLESAPHGIEGILHLKEEFGTSITSTAIRYVKHDVMPCAVIKWHSDEYGWRWVSESMCKRGLVQTRDKVNDLSRDLATTMALQDVDPPEKGYHEKGGTAAYWFPDRRPDANDPILREQAVSLGRFGALTFLYPDSFSVGYE
jgi:Zn-dependent peptidase ImmA (M78 family)